MKPGARDRGLSLIELVAAMAIFALVAVMGAQALGGMIRLRQGIAARSAEAAALDRTASLLRADLAAVVPMLFMQHFGIDHAQVNVNGGAIAMGHPLGATGAIILGTALDELERSGKETALATLCIGSGMGAATIIERV